MMVFAYYFKDFSEERDDQAHEIFAQADGRYIGQSIGVGGLSGKPERDIQYDVPIGKVNDVRHALEHSGFEVRVGTPNDRPDWREP